MQPHVDIGPVVEAGALQMFVVDRKAERLHEMQRGARGRAEPRDTAGVLRNLGMIQHDVHVQLTIINVTGPSLTRLTAIVVWNRPVATRRPDALIRSTKYS